MTEVEIEYCVPCSLLPQAMEVANEILTHDGHRLAGVHLKTGSGGVFKVRMGSELVWDESVDDLDAADVRRRVEERLEAGS